MNHSSSPSILNNTIVKGHTGIYLSGSSSPTITNNIIVGNQRCGIRCESSSPTVSYNNLWDNGTNYEGCSPGPGGISVPPFFVDVSDPDLHLQDSSPCIDAGDPASNYNNEPEPNGGRINLGAYGNTSEATPSQEIFVPDWYVDASVTSSGDGTSWETAFKTITEGIKAARHDNTVHVAAGTYYENVIIYWQSLKLFGEDKETTIIDGGDRDTVPIGIFVVADNFDLKGFTVRNSSINIKLEGSENATIAESVLTSDDPFTTAAGIHMNNSSGNMVTGCLLTNNFRGIYVSGNDNYIAGNILSDNDESGVVVGGSGNHIVGNAIYSSREYGIWLRPATNTSIVNNIIDNVGTGVRLACDSSNNIVSSNILSNCFHSISDASSEINVITNNLMTQGYSYHDIILYSSSPKIVNNTIANNENCGIYCLYSSNPEIVNNIVTGNRCFGIFADESSAPVVSFSDVWGNATNYSGIADQTGVNGNISADPMFIDPGNGDYHLQADSCCIDAGINEGAPDTDFEGDPRPYNVPDVDNNGDLPEFDIGADEYVPTALHMECFEVNLINVIDMKRYGAKRDTINIKGSLNLAEGTDPFDSYTDDVTVDITFDEDVITVSIPAGSFNEKNNFGFHYYCFKGKINGVGRVDIHLNFDECRWWTKIRRMDASGLVDSDGATIKLTIGMNEGTDIIENWTKKKERRRVKFVKFIEWPQIHCCHICP